MTFEEALYISVVLGGLDHMAAFDHVNDIPGPRWTDLFYIAVAFGTASGLFWLAGFLGWAAFYTSCPLQYSCLEQKNIATGSRGR